MSIHPENQDEWNDCPAGELSRMASRLNLSQKRAHTRKLYRSSLLSMLLVAVGVVVVGSVLTPISNHYGGITCAECKSHFETYHSHLTGVAQIGDSALSSSMATHLANCGFCKEKFRQSYPGVLDDTVAMSTRPALLPRLPALAVSWQVPLH